MTVGLKVTDDDLIKALAEAVKGGSSQDDIAKLAGMSQGHLSKIVGRKATLTGKSRRKLITALGLTPVTEVSSGDSIVRLTEELETLPAEMREPIGSALLAALDVLLRFSRENEPAATPGAAE